MSCTVLAASWTNDCMDPCDLLDLRDAIQTREVLAERQDAAMRRINHCHIKVRIACVQRFNEMIDRATSQMEDLVKDASNNVSNTCSCR